MQWNEKNHTHTTHHTHTHTHTHSRYGLIFRVTDPQEISSAAFCIHLKLLLWLKCCFTLYLHRHTLMHTPSFLPDLPQHPPEFIQLDDPMFYSLYTKQGHYDLTAYLASSIQINTGFAWPWPSGSVMRLSLRSRWCSVFHRDMRLSASLPLDEPVYTIAPLTSSPSRLFDQVWLHLAQLYESFDSEQHWNWLKLWRVSQYIQPASQMNPSVEDPVVKPRLRTYRADYWFLTLHFIFIK